MKKLGKINRVLGIALYYIRKRRKARVKAIRTASKAISGNSSISGTGTLL